ncbi:a-pheromone processing metallopeptidase Ste23 [Metarhizium robertsii ARSEF 23]|uniref:A-pheromone processing metallopeptidase Ste23 n=1 Tax=Metarhizium robertsii (strain ARSEF 23 / ATCC MYA-3075) TaxID=655844 RepID=A0A0B2XCW5_METRA|nr:a-pheromone processing metallopeptidase Ste23 [Metarhizium robertsii ARSEF 23]KHO10570.1 a-pheromone processing metallopeptidase Ste23 [Metarhizium robertsii ARSEF 23]
MYPVSRRTAEHYSANQMKLVVLGREPLDVLQNWVVELFSSIENKNLEQNRWSDREPFRLSDLGTQCFAKPVMDSRVLRIVFPFMDEHSIESPPSEYIGHLVGHEGPGSIMAYIKSKGWANSLAAGLAPVCAGSPDNFEVRVELTEEYLPQEWIFQEQKHLADVEFKFRQKISVSDFTSRTSSLMQTPLDWRWLLRGHSGVGKFDPSLIAESLEHFRPENMRIVILSRDFRGDWDKKETWYGTEYRHEKIPAELIVEFKKSNEMSKDKRLHLNYVCRKRTTSSLTLTSLKWRRRSVLDSGGSNFVYKKTLEDGKNVNHCIETFFYVGHQGDCQARAKTRLVEQMIQEPAFDQLRTKERLGYIVFSDLRNLTTTFGLRLLVQTEKTPEHLDRRIEAFLKQFGEQLQGMSEGEFKSHKRSLIIKLLNKLDNLKQESSRHWDHIESEDYNFERNQGDAALIQPLTKSEMIEFYNSYFHPSSTTRARLSVHLEAQGAGNLDTKVIGVLKENGPEDIPQEKRQSVHLLRSYLEGEMKKSSDALNSVIEGIKKLGLSQDDQGEAVGGQGISDVRDFKAGLCVSAGAKAVKQISEFEETDKQ